MLHHPTDPPRPETGTRLHALAKFLERRHRRLRYLEVVAACAAGDRPARPPKCKDEG